MQKVVTIAIDTTQLNKGKAGAFAVNELPEINEVLELGWQIEEWDFLKEAGTDGQVVLMVILNDELAMESDLNDFDMEFDDAGDEEDNDLLDEIKEKKD